MFPDLSKARIVQELKAAKPLAGAEIATVRADTIAALAWFFGSLDEWIELTNKKHAAPIIWGDMDDEEVSTIVDALMQRAQRSVAAAVAVRGISSAWRYYAVGIILGPRLWHTMRLYMEAGIGL